MPQKIDLAQLLKDNPQIDPEKLMEGLKMAEELRRSRFRGGHKRTVPSARRRVRIVDDLENVPLNATFEFASEMNSPD